MRAAAVVENRSESRAAGHPRRIAHLIHTIAHGGVETALINWLRRHDRTVIEPYLMCFDNRDGSDEAFVRAALDAGIGVHPIPWGRRKPVIRAAREVAAFLRTHQIQLLHTHNTYANLVGVLAAKAAGVRTVTTIYVWSAFGVRRRVLQWVDHRLLPYFSQVTAHCGKALEETAVRGVPRDAIRLLPCGFDQPQVVLNSRDYRERRAALGASPDDLVIIKVARFWPEKRHDVALRAFRILVERIPRARLWLPGVGPQLDAVQRLAQALGIADRVSFLGFRTDLPELLALSDIQVHTSDEEGVPLAILSGMAAARPIVSTRVGGIPEVLDDERSGVLVAPGDPLAVASALFDLAGDPLQRRVLGCHARSFVRDEYSLDAATRRVESLYVEVLGR